MKRNILYFFVSVLILGFVLSFTNKPDNHRNNQQQPLIVVSGDEPRNLNSVLYTGDINNINGEPFTNIYSDSIVQITDVYTGVSSLYDLQSNAVTQHLVQWYKDTIHAVFMQNNTSGLPVAQRRCLYLVSTNAGATWTNLGEVTGESGFPAVDVFSDGRAIVGCHPNLGGTHVVLFKDLLPLIGSFTACDPGGGAGTTRVWPRFAVTPSNKVVFAGAYNPTGGADTVTWLNSLTNEVNCTFSGWVVRPQMDNAEQYSFARAANGSIGLAYITNDFQPANGGDVHYMTTTNEGITWSTPTVVYDATPNPDQFLGANRSVDLVYVGNTPKITFGVIWGTNTGTYYPGFNGRIMFWSPDVNSGNPFVIVDSTKVPDNPIQSASAINDVYVNICRASIGKSRNEQLLYTAYSVARQETSPNADSTPYFDVYLSWSENGGATWNGYKQVTNLSGPVRDCRYPCLAPVNDITGGYYVNIEYQNDSIPGSATNGAAESPARQHFMRIKLSNPIGVKNIGSEIPYNFNLQQNFPNPFNPSTTIKFAIPKTAFVTLKVYDITGKEIAVLVNENLQVGYKEVVFNSNNLASGIYFYSIASGNYKDTKKMVLVK
jgi:hypothetical protein